MYLIPLVHASLLPSQMLSLCYIKLLLISSIRKYSGVEKEGARKGDDETDQRMIFADVKVWLTTSCRE